MSLVDVDASWATVAPDVLSALSVLQVVSAREAAGYVADALDEQGMRAPAVARVEPVAFARGSSGLPLVDVLATVPAAVKSEIGRGARTRALRSGLSLLEGITETHIADAARLSTKANMVVRPEVKTWTRVLNLPSCGRCAILGGHVYRWNEPQRRHPRCDCRLVMSISEEAPPDRLIDPRAYFDSLSTAEQDKHFGMGVAERIRGGDDVVKAVNSSRDQWRVRLSNERKAAKDAAVPESELGTPQTFMESLIHRVNDRDAAIRNLADAGYVAA